MIFLSYFFLSIACFCFGYIARMLTSVSSKTFKDQSDYCSKLLIDRNKFVDEMNVLTDHKNSKIDMLNAKINQLADEKERLEKSLEQLRNMAFDKPPAKKSRTKKNAASKLDHSKLASFDGNSV